MRWWDDLWLNESFASFASVLAQSQATRFTSAWTTFANVEKTWAYRQDQLSSTHPIAADIPDVQAVEVNFDGITYAKGASVLKQLAAYVGIEQFLRAMQVYFRRYEYGNTTLADLLGVLTEESGRDLSRWSQQWLETAGVNTLRPEFTLDDSGRYGSFAIVQSPAEPGDGPVRDHRLAVGLYRAEGTKLVRTERVELDVSGARTEVPELVGVAQPDLLLVNDEDLTYAKVRLDERSLATVVDRLADVDDPLPRTLCWGAAWDMTRDGEMRGRDYVTLALAGVTRETEIAVVQSIQTKILVALAHYVDRAWAPEGWARLAALAEQQLRAAAPGSDLQLAWARSLAAATRTPEHVAVVRGLLDGTETVAGLAVDTDLRWVLLSALVAVGAAGTDDIDAELTRDPTAAGQRRAATARALRPSAEAKAEAWRLATEDEQLPNAMNEAVIAGFFHPAQVELTAPYVGPYFAVIPGVWEQRSADPAQNVVVGLFPRYASNEAVERAEAFLADPANPPALRRLVAEGRDDTVRSLRGQARDAAG
jgi:aminopeptidase N